MTRMDAREQLIDRDLHELLGGEAPPDLIDSTLQRISADAEGRSAPVVIHDEQDSRLSAAPGMPHRRIPTLLRGLATAAGIILAAGLIIWIIRPGPESTPETSTPGTADRVASPTEDNADEGDDTAEAPPEPEAEDIAGIRERLSVARLVTFTTLLPEEPWVAEASETDRIERLAGLLFHESTEYAGETTPGKTVFRFEFHGPRDSIATVEVDEDGKAAVAWPSGNESGTYVVPPDTLREVKKLLTDVIPYGQSFGVKRSWTGAHSGVTTSRVEFATKGTEWERIWLDHIAGTEDPAPPYTVDFETEMVVAVFGGATINSRGYFVDEILRASTGWIVRIDETTYQTFGGADDVTPYGFFVFPRTAASILIEENVQGELNKPPIWKQTAHRDPQSDEPEDALEKWQAAPSLVGVLHDNHSIRLGVRIITDEEEMTELTEALGIDFYEPIDLEENVVVFAASTNVQSAGQYRFNLHGASADHLVVRVFVPEVQTERGAKLRDIYGLWVLPRYRGKLVVETPIPGGKQEVVKWQMAASATTRR